MQHHSSRVKKEMECMQNSPHLIGVITVQHYDRSTYHNGRRTKPNTTGHTVPNPGTGLVGRLQLLGLRFPYLGTLKKKKEICCTTTKLIMMGGEGQFLLIPPRRCPVLTSTFLFLLHHDATQRTPAKNTRL